MYPTIKAKSFYGKRLHTVIPVQPDGFNSDLEDIEITDDETFYDIDPTVSLERLYVSDSSSDSDDDNIPLSQLLQKSVSAEPNVSRPPLWFSEKDNEFAGHPPSFLGEYRINIDGETPYSFFSKLFPDNLFKMMTEETIRYAVQSGKDSFSMTESDMKKFFGMNIIMTYIKYPAYRMYWSTQYGLRFDAIAETMPLRRYEKIKRFLHFVDNRKRHLRSRNSPK